jgi:hypothetical protein
MAAKVQIRDTGLRSFLRRARGFSGMKAMVGIQGPAATAARSDGLTNVELASIHEFGAPKAGVPQRSFLRSTFDENRRLYEKELERIAGASLSGAEIEGELRLLGEQYRSDVIDKIHSNIPPPLSDATIARKGGEATALINTRQMLGSISVVVRKG